MLAVEIISIFVFYVPLCFLVQTKRTCSFKNSTSTPISFRSHFHFANHVNLFENIKLENILVQICGMIL